MTDASPIELWWSGFAVVGFLMSIMLVMWSIASLRVVISNIERQRARFWGPGWNLVFGLLIAMIFFTLGWAGYLTLGVVALTTPSPPSAQGQQTNNVFGWILIGMEAAHACAMVALYVVFHALSNVKERTLRPQAFTTEGAK